MKRLLASLLLALASLAFVGPQHTEVSLAKFSDHPEEPCTLAYMGDLVFNQYSNYLISESHNQEWIDAGNVWKWELPHDTYYYCQIGGQYPSLCNAEMILNDVKALAAPYFDMSAQDLNVVYIPSYGGGGGRVRTIIADCNNSSNDIYTLIHEGGHAQGLLHSGSWSCPNLDVGEDYVNALDNTNGCAWAIYGDPFSPMGFSTSARHFSTFEREFLGWLPASNIKLVEQSGNVTLSRLDLGVVGTQDVRIPLSADGAYFYTIEYRDGTGVLIRFKISYPYGPDFTGIVNGTHPDPWNHPIAITSTNPFIDPFRGIQVHLISTTATTATINVTTQAGPGGSGDPSGGGKKPHPRRRSRVR